MKLENLFYSDIYNPFKPVLACDDSQIIILYTNYITQVYFKLKFLKFFT